MRRLLKNQGGFTLIELLIVVLIIGVLAGIAVPQVAKYTGSAKKQACHANMKQIENAIEAYMVDNNGQFPDNWQEDIKGYFKDDTVPTCPAGGEYRFTVQTDGKSAELTCSEHDEFKINFKKP